ncbi:ATP synthase complex subunit H-domain-containing protein [Russula earlei]|uniref:ATP synthase complex subunit H-domain-containing protein n=1 Tax=Russula earlei TaxID=71964 RepID=A0ACC0UHK8_9AGAM|nr:ATP synthase complex subunit H-domain-containing protein [Russula earlei]
MSTILKHTAAATRLCARSRIRTYAMTSVARKDLIQELYLKELKSYKAPPAAKDAHVGVVRAFSAPALPSAPTLPDLATELAAYDATEPTRATTTDAIAGHGEPAAGAEAYLAFLEADEAPEEAHH